MSTSSNTKEKKRFSVAYAMQPKKVDSVIQPSLVTYAKQRGIDFIQVDLSKFLVQQGPFHCIVHKLYTPDWKRQLIDFHSKYPDAIIIDSPSDIERLHNRITMLDAVNNLDVPAQISVGVPKQIVVEVKDAEVLLSDSRNLNMDFPVIAKPLLANGSDKSHEMCLVFNSRGLQKVKPPVVLQEFVNHGGILFKVYVAGDHVKCVQRKSLPDVDVANEEGAGVMPFSQISNVDAPAQQQVEEPPLEFIHNIAKGLGEATNLHLFNFDMIRDTRAGNSRYLIIDINYFPGYAKVAGFEALLTDFFCDLITLNNKDATAPHF